jgi:glucosamine--fructose-6-phosphate aminotransferase (isomerizing)
MEALAGLPASADIASEYRYRRPPVEEGELVVAISQSGETADTLAAIVDLKGRGARTLAVTNVPGSRITRDAGGVLLTLAGPEIGVAATKTFTAQLVALDMLALWLARARGALDAAQMRERIKALAALPALVEQALKLDAACDEIARALFQKEHFLYLGRGIHYPIAKEGALKLKEISYIHAEGYAAGEMKHGPIALISAEMPVVALCPHDAVFDKMLGNLQEVRARDGIVVAVTDRDDPAVRRLADHVLVVPATDPLLQPVVETVPLQLLAYHVALRRGCDVDQPRNLAKSVTVE